jgi:hypothetical protein
VLVQGSFCRFGVLEVCSDSVVSMPSRRCVKWG